MWLKFTFQPVVTKIFQFLIKLCRAQMNQRISCFICQLSFVLVLDLIGPIKEIRRPKANILRSVFWHQLRRISWRLSAIGLPLLNVLGNLLLVELLLRKRFLPILGDHHWNCFLLPWLYFLLFQFSSLVPDNFPFKEQWTREPTIFFVIHQYTLILYQVSSLLFNSICISLC